MQAFYSNRIEKLYERLKESLFNSETNPFSRRLVIVPSPAIKSWLMFQMAKDLGIATGVEILFLEQSIEKMTTRSRLPNHLELSLAIELELRESTPEELTPYFKLVDGKWTRKSERRLIGLSQKLAHLFLQYGIYGGGMIRDWEANKDSQWQARLWRRIYTKMNWDYVQAQMLNADLKEGLDNIEVHLFLMSYLSPAHHTFLLKVSEQIPTNYYLLSPCQAFWSDICSDKERRQLQKFWKKRDVSQSQQQELEEYLRGRNPLLANFGRLGREMAKNLEESDVLTHSNYVMRQAFEGWDSYKKLIFEEMEWEDRPITLLGAVQSDMVLLRNQEPANKLEMPESDRSIQVHLAGSKQREVQILYNNLLKIISDQPDIAPSDIIVMAPDIMEYEPYIKSVFGSEESRLPFHLIDLYMPSQSRLAQGFLDLLALPMSRWDTVSVMRLFNNSGFQQCHKFNWEDINQISNWLRDLKVRWGEDIDHRDELLLRDHCEQGMSEPMSHGTWNHGFSRLLAGLVMKSGENAGDNSQVEVLPYEGIDATQGELLGKFMALLRSLRADLRPLTDGSKMRMGQWSLYLKCLLQSYFGVDEFKGQLSEDALALIEQINLFARVDKELRDRKFTFDTVRAHFEKALNNQKTEFREGNLNSIRFCSMLPMRAVPAEVIALLGMNEGAYPRVDNNSSLNVMTGHPDVDYSPSQTDYDRYLFLEALLSARSYFLMSYIALSPGDGHDQPPSLLVSELLDYIHSGFNLGRSLIVKHPFYEFDAFYFSQNEYPSYLNSHYRLAQAHYYHNLDSHCFIPNFSVSKEVDFDSHEIVIDIKDLSAFAKNPLKTYFKELGLYIRDEETDLTGEEDFALSQIELSRITRAALKEPLESIIEVSEKQGLLPPGAFKGVALEKIKQEVQTLRDNLTEVGVDPKEIFEIEFSLQCDKPTRTSQGWQVPAIDLSRKDKSIKIVGKLQDVTSKGLIAYIKDSKNEVAKAWPQYLLLNMLLKSNGLSVENQLIFAKSGKAKSSWFDNPNELMQKYLDYYFAGKVNASPLLPNFIHDFVESDSEELHARLNKKMNDEFNLLYNDHLEWMCPGGNLPDCSSLGAVWKEKAKDLYGDLIQNWYS